MFIVLVLMLMPEREQHKTNERAGLVFLLEAAFHSRVFYTYVLSHGQIQMLLNFYI